MLDYSSKQYCCGYTTPFLLLSEIANKMKIVLPSTESELCSNEELLSYCIDTLLADELCNQGLNEADIPNSYGLAIEKAIDHYNHIRWNNHFVKNNRQNLDI